MKRFTILLCRSVESENDRLIRICINATHLPQLQNICIVIIYAAKIIKKLKRIPFAPYF